MSFTFARLGSAAMAAIALSMLLAACGRSTEGSSSPQEMPERELIEQAKQQIVSRLNDPSSAQFRNVEWQTPDALVVLCGEFNAKNALGGYGNFQPFYAVQPGLLEKGRYDPDSPLVVHVNERGPCR